MIDKPRVYVLSDLHFDSKMLSGSIRNKLKELHDNGDISSFIVYENKVKNNPNYHYSKQQVQQNIESVITLLDKNKNDSVFVLAGDFFDDLNATLNFIDTLEKLKITSFVVLGNHDYWSYSKESRTLLDSIKLATVATENNEYCRLLVTGRKYTVGKLTFIGDSGFSNLRYYDPEFGGQEQIATTEDLQQITADTQNIKALTARKVVTLHNKWVRFANKSLKSQPTGQPIFLVTHWPMNQTATQVSDSWFKTQAGFPLLACASDQYGIAYDQSYWLISGHTHHDEHYSNEVSTQAGYRNEAWFEQLTLDDFGQLVPTEKLFGLLDISNALENFQDFSVGQEGGDIEVSDKVKLQGYRRAGSAGNKEALYVYLANSDWYIESVQNELDGLQHVVTGNCGYTDVLAPELYRAVTAIKAGIEVLKRGYDHNPFDFFTALVVTGYAYNDRIYEFRDFRKVTVVDVIRQAMVYLTIMSIPEISVNNIESIRSSRNKWSSINVANYDIPLPIVNHQHLDLAAFLSLADSFNHQLLGDQVAKQKRLLLEEKIDAEKKYKSRLNSPKPKRQKLGEPVRIPFKPIIRD